MASETLFIDALADEVSGHWLVVEPPAATVAAALEAAGAQTTTWSRYAYCVPEASAVPPEGPFEAAVLALPKGKETLAYAVELIASRLPEGSTLYVYGHNDDGIKSAAKKLKPWFEEPETLDAKRHSRLYRLTRTAAPARGALSDFASSETLTLITGEATFVGYPGLFAKRTLDQGTALLAAVLPTEKRIPGRVCDVACGMGVLTKVVAEQFPDAEIIATDADALAVAATRAAVPRAEVHLMDGWQLPAKERFDLVIANPPIHEGQRLELGVVYQIIEGAARTLKRRGRLLMVVQRQRPLEISLKKHFKHVTVAAEDSRFRVWLAHSA